MVESVDGSVEAQVMEVWWNDDVNQPLIFRDVVVFVGSCLGCGVFSLEVFGGS